MRKKQIFLVATCMSTALILSSCNSNTSSTTSTSSSEEETVTETSENEIPEGNQIEGNWVYEVSAASNESGAGGPGGDAPGGGAPSGEAPSGEAPSGEAPDGSATTEEAPEMPDGDSTEGTSTNDSTQESTSSDDSTSANVSDAQGNASQDENVSQGDNSTDDGTSPMSSNSSEATATILWGNGDETASNVTMIPATLGGYTVTILGNGAQNITSNNKNEDNYVLIPDGVTTLSARMIYDYNTTNGWSIPSSVTSIADGAFLSSAGTFYGESGSAAEDYATTDDTRDFVSYTDDGSATFSATAENDNGYLLPNGNYTLPSGMLDGSHTTTFSIVADYQYKIASLTVDGEEVSEAAGQNEYELDYTFTNSSSKIYVTFEEDPDDSRDPDEMNQTYSYDAPEIESAAVTSDIDLTDEALYEYVPVNNGSTQKYVNTMGISTGEYYAADGKVYQMVYSSQATEEPEYYSKAEAINGVYDSQGMVYGKDYDLIRLYNYYEAVDSGPSQGEVSLYCTYFYKEISADDIAESTVDNTNTNTASIFVQEGGDLTLSNFISNCYTSSKGPSEAGNFFGLGSSIHVDGGDVTTAATNTVNQNTSKLSLINAQILGTVNSLYAAASGVIDIAGGNVFSCSSGGHGPYVSTGGQIYLNTEGTNILDDDGNINSDVDSLVSTTRPSSDLGTMTRIDGNMAGVFQEHDDDVTVIVTGDESGTALATDTGGGVIVANQVATKTFGLRCAGVYSIGSNESWVYCYNSSLTSYLDAALCSASGGYIFANNCDLTGVMGIKTRSGGDSSSDETGVHVSNSRVSVEYDTEEMQNAYDVATPDQWDDSILDEIEGKGATSINQLNLFLDKANTPSFYEDSLTWWFTDKSKTPGYSGGNKFAVIYVENSSTPIYVNSTQLRNKNYEEYGDASKLEDGQTPADNLLVSVEGAGNANLYFTDENSSTSWDTTGAEAGTCELNGDFYIGEYSNNEDGSPNIGTGANTLNATFSNSEWEGTILYGDEDQTGAANLTFDKNSYWKVTDDTVVNTLEVENIDNITADQAVTITYTTSSTITAGTYGNVTFVCAE